MKVIIVVILAQTFFFFPVQTSRFHWKSHSSLETVSRLYYKNTGFLEKPSSGGNP